MFTMHRLLIFIALIATPFVITAPAEALTHTWVSNSGSDNNSCDVSSPCATFAGAYAKTYSGGEISCLTSGNFGTSGQVTITMSITINCEGALGGTSVAGGNNYSFFSIQTQAGAVVVLRGLDLDGFNVNGCFNDGAISFNGAGVLRIEKSKISNSGKDCGGVYFLPNGPAELDISETDITDNVSQASGTTAGVNIAPRPGGTAIVSISRSKINGNYFGIVGDGRQGGIIKGTISDSVVSGNTENGVTALSSGSSVVFTIDQTEISVNLAGLFASGGNAGMLANNSTVFNNTIGLDTANGGALFTYGNNRVNGNATNGAFTGTAGLQ